MRRTTRKGPGNGGKKEASKSSRRGVSNKLGGGSKKITMSTDSRQTRGDRDGRMQAARQKELDNDVKKAGGSRAYLEKAKAAKSNQIKYKDRYYSKTSKQGKAVSAARKNNPSYGKK